MKHPNDSRNKSGNDRLLDRLGRFRVTRFGCAVFGLVELGLAYLVAQRALTTGSLIIWTIVMVLFVGFMQNMIFVLRRQKV